MDPDPLSLFAFLLAFNASYAIEICVLILLLICSALISGAEVAFFGLSPTDLHQIEEGKSTQGEIVVKLLEKPKKLLATILIANNAINIGIVLLFNTIGDTLFAEITYKLFGILSVRFLLEVVVVTFLILMFGEILPKVYANRNRVSFSMFMAYPLKVLDFIFSPMSMPMRSATLFIYDKLGKEKSSLSVDQLSQALELTSDGDTTKEEQKILEGIVSFGNTDTKQVMRPRIDIFALGEELKFPEVLDEIKKNGYSRIPVFSESIDNVIGVLYVKDVLPYIDRKTFNWVSLIRDPYFVPENKKLDDLLAEFQEKKNHLAVVVDEYGGTSGIVTLEDLAEEIENINGINYLSRTIEMDDSKIAKTLISNLEKNAGNAVILLGVKSGDKVQLMLQISKTVIEAKGLHAGNIIRELSTFIDGGGGGQDFFATAGGKKAEGLNDAYAKMKAMI